MTEKTLEILKNLKVDKEKSEDASWMRSTTYPEGSETQKKHKEKARKLNSEVEALQEAINLLEKN